MGGNVKTVLRKSVSTVERQRPPERATEEEQDSVSMRGIALAMAPVAQHWEWTCLGHMHTLLKVQCLGHY